MCSEVPELVPILDQNFKNLNLALPSRPPSSIDMNSSGTYLYNFHFWILFKLKFKAQVQDVIVDREDDLKLLNNIHT